MSLIVLEGIDVFQGGAAPSRFALHPHGLGRGSPAEPAWSAALRAIFADHHPSVARSFAEARS